LENIEIFFESYNLAAEEGHNRAFEGKTPEKALKMKKEDIDSFLQESINEWSKKSVSETITQTPEQIVESIEDLATAMEFFRLGSKLCDKDLPQILLDKIRSFGIEAEHELIRLVMDSKLANDEENIYIMIMAINVLGKWKVKKAIPAIIKAMDNCADEKEIVLEEAIDTLISIGRASADTLMNRLNAAENINCKDEYIMTALVKISKDEKSDDVYNCLKDTFNKMEDKILGAMCIGDYGDWRAITMLKGHLIKQGKYIDKDTYNEIKATIKRLGGDISDI